eukprot:6758831-Pyramimonas_sp.AAC.1
MSSRCLRGASRLWLRPDGLAIALRAGDRQNSLNFGFGRGGARAAFNVYVRNGWCLNALHILSREACSRPSAAAFRIQNIFVCNGWHRNALADSHGVCPHPCWGSKYFTAARPAL